MGAVQIDENTCIGMGSSILGINNEVFIGKNTIVGHYVSMRGMYLDKFSSSGAVKIGDNVFIGDKAVIRNCIIDDDVFIGDNCTIFENVIIERGAIILPNTVVPEGSVIKSKTVWKGNPLKEV